MNAVNEKLSKFSVGQYLVISIEEEYSYNKHSHRYGEPQVLEPPTDFDQWKRFDKIFLRQGHYCDRDLRGGVEIVCLCKVIEIRLAQKVNENWRYPCFLVENVATHETFDFACACRHGSDKRKLVMPFLVLTRIRYQIIDGLLFDRKKRIFEVQQIPYYIAAGLSECTNDEAAAHLRHIAMIKKMEKEKAERPIESVDKATLEMLYRNL